MHLYIRTLVVLREVEQHSIFFSHFIIGRIVADNFSPTIFLDICSRNFQQLSGRRRI